MSCRAAKRRRRQRTKHFEAMSSAQIAAEERIFQIALQNSKLDSIRKSTKVDQAPVFFASVEDMKGSPLAFVEKIRGVAQEYGMAKIVPPPGWDPGCCFGEFNKQLFCVVLCVVFELF